MLRKMLFPNERSYHAFQLTGNPWATLILVILATLAVIWSSSTKGNTDFPESVIGDNSEMTQKYAVNQASMDVESEPFIIKARSD